MRTIENKFLNFRKDNTYFYNWTFESSIFGTTFSLSRYLESKISSKECSGKLLRVRMVNTSNLLLPIIPIPLPTVSPKTHSIFCNHRWHVNRDLFNSKPESGFRTLLNTAFCEAFNKLSVLVQELKTYCQFGFERKFFQVMEKSQWNIPVLNTQHL